MSEAAVTVALSAEAVEAIAARAAEIALERLGAQRPELSPWLTVEEAARWIGASRQRIYDLRSSGRLNAYADGGRALVRRDELDAYVRGYGSPLRAAQTPGLHVAPALPPMRRGRTGSGLVRRGGN